MKRKTKEPSPRRNAKPLDVAHATHTNSHLRTAITKRRSTKTLSSFQRRLQSRLDSGHFRMLNESMYTTTGAQSLQLMKQNPHLFQLYHTGYAEQVKRWPKNPLDVIIRYLSSQSASKRIADLGCGEARLAREVPQQHVKSFDLIAANDHVVQCDIAHVPLTDSSVDIAVFCLSLMGTNYGDFIQEARRILAPNGLVIIAEVASRFENQNPTDFIRGVESAGFRADKGHPLSKHGLSAPVGASQTKRGAGKKRKRKQVTNQPDNRTNSAFFHIFAFRSTKKEMVESSGRDQQTTNLPKLAACIYKKR